VPTGKKLAIYDRTINLNSYYIKCEGSGKIINKGTITG